ncbi:sulfurtransferase TusA family protein [Aestuariivirga litoralis]|uniref:sulfurtransferase TusA family protein n=1 Tax=Aestuariivirga litoralis TaxID=2650924 RepID=UPI0018C4C7A7|nr:sulfurtransferase TusA family protein [Aestuariivirga litoralis]MBG1233718.1 sulfurtransferase TusA family protein [Aestuariivirga litoralis]
MDESQADFTLDLSGLLCPLPVLKARKKLLSMPAGQVLHVIATDPMAAIDMPHFCTEQGHQLLRQEKSQTRLNFWIRRAP